MAERKLLILTDFTQACYQSLTYGLEFCRHYSFAAEILHVEGLGGYVDDAERAKVRTVVSLYSKKYGIKANVSIKEGQLVDVIVEEVKSHGIMLIIMGTHGKTGLQSITGSAASKVIESQDIPVILVQGKHFTPIRKALLPVSTSNVDVRFWAMYVELMDFLGASVTLAFRPEDFSAAEYLKTPFTDTDMHPVDMDSKRSAVRVLLDYAESSDFDIILLIHSNSEITPLQLYINEQIMFNISQIPVMCS